LEHRDNVTKRRKTLLQFLWVKLTMSAIWEN